MKSVLIPAGAALILASLASIAFAQERKPALAETDEITATAIVQSVDQQRRILTLRDENGNTVKVKIGEDIQGFSHVKPGDKVEARYLESVAVQVRKQQEPPSAREQTVVIARPGDKPTSMEVNTTQVTATIDKVEPERHRITLRGPEGKTRTYKVGKDVDLSRLQKGDQVMVTLTEAIAIGVAAPQPF